MTSVINAVDAKNPMQAAFTESGAGVEVAIASMVLIWPVPLGVSRT